MGAESNSPRADDSKGVSYYLSLPYTIVLHRDAEGDVVARIDELPGCISHGRDEVEAIARLRDMQKLWLEDCLEAGEVAPEPEAEKPLPSGKWVQRVPRSLHGSLVRMARSESVSLNQLVTSMLSQQVVARTLKPSEEQSAAQRVRERPRQKRPERDSPQAVTGAATRGRSLKPSA